MDCLYTFHFSLESAPPVMTLDLSVSAVCLRACEAEALSPTLLQPIETALLYKLPLFVQCVHACPCVDVCTRCVSVLLLSFDKAAVVCSCSLCLSA